ncbi:myomegalin-like isoform X3 [Gouania willdenowi]|uniref:myomegalin-like isoform X3 n=1 Tax=Gouania willdenowi TaxID=441366 RepID=UPI00105582F2|nr:myomegalin-like isoform X3 [Gouania willdenowi]
MDSSCDPGPGRLRHTPSVREFEQHLNDLKKENFSLKLRIYFLEEKVQQKFEEGGENVHRENIELKVEVESLKKELEEKEQLIDQSLSTAENKSEQHNDFRKDHLQSLQAKIRESETRNQKIQARLSELQSELRSAREESQRMDQSFQVGEFDHVTEEQKKKLQAVGENELQVLKASLFQAELQLQKEQREKRQALLAKENLQHSLEKLQNNLQVALQHRTDTEEHNQELQTELEKSQCALQEINEHLREEEMERRREREDAQRHLQELKTCLQNRKQQLQECWELVDEPRDKRDVVLYKLRQRVRDRDAALERVLDDKFCHVEEKEAELCKLQQLLREKEHDSERQRRALRNNEETISSLELLLRGKNAELTQLNDAWKDVQRLTEKRDELEESVVKERDVIISELQGALHASTQEVQDLRSVLLPQVQSAPAHVLEELKLRLQLKDRLFQEVLTDRSRQAQQHQQQVQELCEALSSRDQYMQESTSCLGAVLNEQSSRLQELRRQLSSSQIVRVNDQILDPPSQDTDSIAPDSDCGENHQRDERKEEEEEGVEQELLQLWDKKTEGQRDCKELLTQTVVLRRSKQVQVDLQDLGYETCGRSENEAEREDTSSPEFDDLEMCTSLYVSSQWWSAGSGSSHSVGRGPEASSLQRLVEELRSQLSRSQAVIRGLRGHLHSGSYSNPQTSEDEGWQEKLRPFRQDNDLQELISRVDALEDQLRNKNGAQDKKSTSWTGKFDSLIQAQARELSVLRQRLREGSGVCGVLTQHVCDTIKAFEELLRANDVDFYSGQSFREQLNRTAALIHRVRTKIHGPGDQSEDSDDKTELLAIRLSKELQQKDKLIESLRDKLDLHHPHPQRSDTPCSSHAPSDATDLSDRISYVSDEQAPPIEDLELELSLDETPIRDGADAGSVVSMATCLSCPVPRMSSAYTHSASGESAHVAAGCHPPSHRALGFSLSDVNQELQMLQKQLQNSSSSPQCRPLHAVSSLHPAPHFSQYSQSSPLGSDAGVAIKADAHLLESSALWDLRYGPRPLRPGAELSSGSSGYQSGTSNTGSDLMKEHLREIKSLRQRLEDSIHTNERLRQQLEDKLAQSPAHKAPTNIYIQSGDSVNELSSELRLLKEEKLRLQQQLTEGSIECSKLKEAELEAEKWAERSREKTEEAEQLKKERIRNQETIDRLKLELSKHTVMTQRSAVGLHAVGHVDDLTSLQQQILEGSALLQRVQENLLSLNSPQELPQLLRETQTLSQILGESDSLLRKFWKTSLPDSEDQDQVMVKEELLSLRLKLSQRDRALRDATEIIQSSNRTKDSMEQFIVSQLLRTRTVLSRAKTNLQENQLRMSFILPSSSSPPSSSSAPAEAQIFSRGFCELYVSPGRSFLTSGTTSSKLSALHKRHHQQTQHQRPLQAASI